MEKILSGKVCLVTGAGQGIGAAIARMFAEAGGTVYANGITAGKIEKWIGECCENVQQSIKPVYFDVADETAAKESVFAIKKEAGRLDVLVNNAGVEFNELIGMISRKNMQTMYDVNVFGTINMLQTVSRVMQRQPEGGSIINIASLVGLRGNSGQLGYSATKGAVVSVTKSAAKELAGRNIRVNAIAPGLTKTPMMMKVEQEKLQTRIDNICMGRLAEPNDIARACLFFASELSEYVSGQVLAVDGCTIM